MRESESGPARFIVGKMRETLGRKHTAKQGVQWLEGNARNFWDGEDDLPLFQVADNGAMVAHIVVPGQSTLAAHPDTANYGIHFRKDSEAAFLNAKPPYGIIEEIKGHRGPLHGAEYEYKTGNLIQQRLGGALPYIEYLGYTQDTIRSRVIPGQSLSTFVPTALSRKVLMMPTRVQTADVLEGLEFWNTIKHAFGALKGLNEKGIAHRDAALRNFMMTDQGVLPIDFGGATLSQFEELTRPQTLTLLEKEAGDMATTAAELQYHVTGRIDDPVAEAMIEYAIEHNAQSAPAKARQFERIPEMTANLDYEVPDEYEWGRADGPTDEELEEMENLGVEDLSMSWA